MKPAFVGFCPYETAKFLAAEQEIPNIVMTYVRDPRQAEVPDAPFQGTPERRLLGAMISRAIMDARSNVNLKGEWESGVARDTRDEALEWLSSSDHEPWGFLWICDWLGYGCSRIAAIRRSALMLH